MEHDIELLYRKLLGLASDEPEKASIGAVESELTESDEPEKASIGAVESELTELLLTLKRILLTISDAQELRYIEDDSVHRWLRDFKALAFDVEDVYEEFRTHKILAETKICNRWKYFPVFHLRDFADRVKKQREEYERVWKGTSFHQLLKSNPLGRFNLQRRRGRRQEGEHQDDERFHGRQEETKIIVSELLRHGDNVQVIFIVGSCGSGKTSLARNVFNVAGLEQEKVSGCLKNHFDLRIWVSLSQNFDLVRTIKEVVEAVERRECLDSTLDLLQFHLKNIISGNRFLLVLDNMWTEDLDFWENLRTPLMDGAQGSKILVTTQNEKVANRVQKAFKLPLEGLPEDDGWLLLQDLVFSMAVTNTVYINPKMEIIGRRIVKVCQGHPLAIKAIGSLLYSRIDRDKWFSKVIEIEKSAGDIISILTACFYQLDPPFKCYLAFCSMFPKDYEFDKDEMVKLWMAMTSLNVTEMIIYQEYDGIRWRSFDDSERYFDNLFCMSFFQASDSSMKGKQKYKMPTVIHELAHQLFIYESLSINKDVAEHGKSGMARYGLLYHHDKQSVTFNKMFENKGLRALMLYGKNGLLTKEVLMDLFEKLSFLRILDLSSSYLEELPDSVCKLILLRYLNLHGTNITKLPETVGYLYYLQTLELGNCHQIQELPDSIGDLKFLWHLGLHNTSIRILPESISNLLNLQTLELGNCYKLEKLPEGMEKLKNLRHLGLQLDWDNWDGQIDLISMPPRIGRLKSLRHLSRFAVGSGRHCGLEELNGLILHGKLCITKLENLSVRDAEAANLRDQRYIDSLMLRWSDAAITKEVPREYVIDQLQPHMNLRHLRVENYNGYRFPIWMGGSYFLKLETVKLINCRRCSSLPDIWKLRSLKMLQIKGLHGVEIFNFTNVLFGFASLETLDVSDMPDLGIWFTRKGQMSCLSSLYISDCPKLRCLSYIPPSIRTLELRNCEKLPVRKILPKINDLVLESDSGSRLLWVQHLSSLTSLTLSKISLIQDDHKGIFNYLTSLKQLKVQECYDLDSIDGLSNHSSLEYLEISSCPKLSRIGLPEKLKRFCLQMCPSLKSLPHELHILSSLGVMEIHSVSLAAMPRLPAGVERLVIKECSVLSKRCQKGGVDWPNIKHIPYIQIGQKEYHDGISLDKQPHTCSQVHLSHFEQTIEPPGSTSGVDDAVIYGKEDDKKLLLSDDRQEDISLIQIASERTSKVGDAVIYGREDDKKKVIKLLLSDDCSELDISLIQITGAGGIGKSTLAFLVYNDSMVCEYFDMKAWVHMPEIIDVGRILKAVIESLTGIYCYVTDLNELKHIIGEELSGKRFLIVLDNLRNETLSFWSSLMVSLSIGAKGSIVMVTTRTEIISDLMQSIRPYHLNSLSDKHCFSIFLQYAFDKQEPCIFPELLQTGKHIVAKCQGIPLAAKAVGSLLRINENNLPAVSQYWKDVLESTLWDSDECLPALSLCYDYLPMHMKFCFSYCSLFPEGYIFEKDNLIKLWMSQGYLESTDGEAAEDIGINCFEELLRRTFFQRLHIYDATKQKYRIHDLFHNFAQHVGKECFRMEAPTFSYRTGTISHISLVPFAEEALQFPYLFEQQIDLRSFLFIPRSASKWPLSTVHIENINVLSDLFIKFRYLRSLDLSNTDIKELPDSIESLKSLCYLSLNSTNIRKLPNSICSLCNLQTLELQNCSFLSELPLNIKKLTKLRCLNVFKESGFISMPSGIGELGNLRTLSNLNVGKVGCHCGIVDLQNLLDLRGSLFIAGLENVVSGAQANRANLKMKACLKTLTLHWFQNVWESDVETEQIALDVFQSLKPHTNLEELIIHGYFGGQFPTWLGDPLFCNLVSLTLENCYESVVLPPLGQLPSLRFLSLQKMGSVRTLGPEFCGTCSEVLCGFPSLEILKLWEMYELEEWNWVWDGDFPRLRSLSISMCFKLIKLPPLKHLRELVFHCCDRLPEIPQLKSLEYLKIDGFQKLESLSFPDDLPVLKKLEINNCRRLSWLIGMSQLASVEQFKVSKCPNFHLN